MKSCLVKRLVTCVLILSTMLIVIGCTCGNLFDMVIENHTDQILTIYSGEREIGDVEPGEQIVVKDLVVDFGKYLIIAKNTQGEVVFSETYSFKTNLEKINGRTYKGIIPPLKSN